MTKKLDNTLKIFECIYGCKTDKNRRFFCFLVFFVRAPPYLNASDSSISRTFFIDSFDL